MGHDDQLNVGQLTIHLAPLAIHLAPLIIHLAPLAIHLAVPTSNTMFIIVHSAVFCVDTVISLLQLSHHLLQGFRSDTEMKQESMKIDRLAN